MAIPGPCSSLDCILKNSGLSTYIRHLDIVAQSLERCYSIKAVCYNRTVRPGKCVDIEKAFQQCLLQVPLLVTAGPGTMGLNIATASIVIILEP